MAPATPPLIVPPPGKAKDPAPAPARPPPIKPPMAPAVSATSGPASRKSLPVGIGMPKNFGLNSSYKVSFPVSGLVKAKLP